MKKSEFLETALGHLMLSVRSGGGVCRALRLAHLDLEQQWMVSLTPGYSHEDNRRCWEDLSGELESHRIRMLAAEEFGADLTSLSGYWWPIKLGTYPGEYKSRRAFLEHWINELKAKGE